ncbi:ceramidase domain-containing protein [Aliiroseovarius sp.]|uniref:ceramidase domain-containing protein n=1 Tax=Aliiroseovarius sp. TaxID=1872442 RepID=UPI003BAC7A81
MELTAQIDAYCERTGPEYWSEPVNALTNLAFIIAALIVARRLRGAELPIAWGLTVVLFVIGLGSWLFHTHATGWAAMADVLPILLFILAYIFAANRDFWGLRTWPALGVTALFFPYAAVTVPLFGLIPGLGSSASYAPVPLLIAAYGIVLRHRAPDLGRNLLIGAGILTASITFRALDEPLCLSLPLGTHFLWHILNATMLAWMIETYRRHMLAHPAPGR